MGALSHTFAQTFERATKGVPCCACSTLLVGQKGTTQHLLTFLEGNKGTGVLLCRSPPSASQPAGPSPSAFGPPVPGPRRSLPPAALACSADDTREADSASGPQLCWSTKSTEGLEVGRPGQSGRSGHVGVRGAGGHEGGGFCAGCGLARVRGVSRRAQVGSVGEHWSCQGA